MSREPNTVQDDRQPLVTASSPKKDVAMFWQSRPKVMLHRIDPTPVWRHRGDVNMPLLANVGCVDSSGPLQFGGGPAGEMDTFAFEAQPGKGVEYVGVAAIKGKVPDAYLIYFRHTINMDKDFQGEHKLLETGIGDYLIGRMQACRQILNSGKNVAVVLPVGKSGPGKFASDPGFVEQCLTDINDELFNATTPPPLLLACNSDGIMNLKLFLDTCKQLVGRVKAVYDLDGSLVKRAHGITLMNAGGARVFRYTQHPQEAGAPQGLGTNPVYIPLPLDRWSRYPDYPRSLLEELGELEAERARKKPRRKPITETARIDQIHKQIQDWLHHRIPTCMLQHGLASTNGI